MKNIGIETKNPRLEHLRWAQSCQKASPTRNLLALASSHQRLNHGLLDADPFLLNCRNGTLDLSNGRLRPHSAKDLITKIVDVDYNESAACPRWVSFLNEIFNGDTETINFVHRGLGYSITGDVTEQCFFICYGTGANGKSTISTLMTKLLGDYAATLPPGLLIARKHDPHPTELASLYRARFTTTSEVKTDAKWDEERIKMLTGGDPIKARRMREDFWEFNPTHKIWISVNHKPATADSSYGFWRRVRMIPFSVRIPEIDQDPKLLERLLAEMPGILTWLVQGALLWKENGLGSAKSVEEATDSYRNPQNDLAAFVEACCQKGNGLRIQAKLLYERYSQWCASERARPLRQVEFGQRMQGLGWGTTKISVNFYEGLALNPQPDESEDITSPSDLPVLAL